ncbi:tetratricopeptide repeat protein [Kiloniella majae]|uniref:tetratricopeptide repeat protein n=1 Tax=Kiloniella majae TaxID=1938558 RepID=UPI001302CBBF|nr:tetratricopeptide repeat protein [Kiloniella majae]
MGDPVQTEEETRNDLLEAQKTVSKTESISARQVSQKVAKSASQIQQQGKGTSSASAIRTYSKLYRAGEYDKAIELLKSLIKKDNPCALYLMADMYFRGLGVKRDTKQAFLLFERSALLDYSKAQAKVAYHYLAGTGTNKNLDKAHNWALKSAVQGDEG